MRQKSSRVAAMRLIRSAAQNPPQDPLDSLELVRLTEEFLKIKQAGDEDSVITVVRMGRLLIEGRPQTGRCYGRWLTRLGTGHTTAGQYEAVVHFAQRHPHEFDALKGLGAAKMYRVLRLRPAGLRLVTTARFEELRDMSYRRFAALTARYVPPVKPASVAPAIVFRRVRSLERCLARMRRPSERNLRERFSRALRALETRASALRRRL